MSGVVYYRTKKGATKQFAEWLSRDAGFELRDINDGPKPGCEDIVVVGSSIIIGKLIAASWIKKHWSIIGGKQVVLFVVAGAKVDSEDRLEALEKSLTKEMLGGMRIFHLRGRHDLSQSNFLFRKIIKVAMESETDPEVKRDWLEGFDDVKEESLEPIKAYIDALGKG